MTTRADHFSERGSRLHTAENLWSRPSIVVWFVVLGIVFQIGMWLWGDSSFRLPMRIGTYAVSLALVVLVRGHSPSHPATKAIPFILLILIAGLMHPETNGIVAGVAQISLYLAVLAPLIWVGKLDVTTVTFQRLVILMWLFYTCSAVLGAMQVRYPGQFDGAMSSAMGEDGAQRLGVMLADGSIILRPKGLTDVPGGAGVAGVYAIILGVGLFLTTSKVLVRVLTVCGMILGLFCIYICHGRTNLVIVGVALLSLIAVLAKRGHMKQVAMMLTAVAVVIFVGTSIAFAVGGESTIDRWASLVADDPGAVFQQNRGQFLDAMLTEDVLSYPIGAGQGRWGMMSVYFGTGHSTDLWAEMMWQSLLYDGGIPLILLYILLIATILRVGWQRATAVRDTHLGIWGGVVFGYMIAAVAASFVFPIFSLSIGMEAILLNACFTAVCTQAFPADRASPFAEQEPQRRLRRPRFRRGRHRLSPTASVNH